MRAPLKRMFALFLGLALLVAVVSGCGGGGDGFVPNSQPFSGTFTTAEGTPLGAFSFTASGGYIAGTATLRHLDRDYTLSISGTYSDQSINGQIKNALEGSGTMTGSFSDAGTAGGTFVFTDTLGLDTTAGNWNAAVPD